MRTVADPSVLSSLVQRLSKLEPTAERRWGTLTAHEMLCHLGDTMDMVLGRRPRAQPLPRRSRPIMRSVGLWSPIRWPHGWRTNPAHDPKLQGTRPSDFTADRDRVVRGLEALSAGGRNIVEPVHSTFGTMAAADWQRWAFKHADHHLRQFGL